jgi:hypothetical protein
MDVSPSRGGGVKQQQWAGEGGPTRQALGAVRRPHQKESSSMLPRASDSLLSLGAGRNPFVAGDRVLVLRGRPQWRRESLCSAVVQA